MRTEGIIIHLARAEGRRPQVDELLRTLPVPSEVLDATDGSKLSPEEIDGAYKLNLHRPHYPFELRIAEIGCFLSHRAAWRRIVERDLDAGVIIEDDVGIEPDNFAAAVCFAQERMTATDYVRFPWRGHTDAGRVMADDNGLSLVEPRGVGVGMLAQVVGREAARRLLETTERFDRPVDTFLQMRWAHDARMLAVRGVRLQHLDAQLGGTTLHKRKRPLAESLTREALRARYRAEVALRDLGRR